MKKITTFLGCVGVVCLFWGCSSSEDILDPNAAFADDEEIASSESGDTPTSSSSSTSKPSSSAAKQDPKKDPAHGSTDSVVVEHDTVTKQVVIIQDANLGEIPTPNFRKDEVFCWTEECKTKYAGQTTNPDLQPSSSSMTIDIGTEPPVVPEVSENKMVDKRDNQSYKLTRVGGLHWMEENLKYKPSKGFFCEEKEGVDVCTKHGVFYTYSVALNICPTGWRLPTQAEVEAANLEKGHNWWTVGGRFKLTANGESDGYGLEGEQGYLWLAAGGENNAWRIEHYSEKKLEEATSATDRAFNVRCVEGE